MRHEANRIVGEEKRASAQGAVNGQAQCTEADYVMLKLQLSLAVRRWLTRSDLSWRQLERRIGSGGAEVHSIERLDASVSLDLLTRALLELGATQRDIALEIVRHT